MASLLHTGHLGRILQAGAGPIHAGHDEPALVALTFLPVAILAVLTSVETGARAGLAAAVRLRGAYLGSPAAARLAALGLAISASIHLAIALAEPHAGTLLAVLLALDGTALLAVACSAAALPVPGWRVAGALLLSAGLIAYAVAVSDGLEELDVVGVATKLVELATLGTLVAAARRPTLDGGLFR